MLLLLLLLLEMQHLAEAVQVAHLRKELHVEQEEREREREACATAQVGGVWIESVLSLVQACNASLLQSNQELQLRLERAPLAQVLLSALLCCLF